MVSFPSKHITESALDPFVEAACSKWSLKPTRTLPNKCQAITFGLELEFNLAFTEQVLLNTLDQYDINYNHIQKHHSDSAHAALLAAEDYSKTCRSRYPSWGVAMPLNAEDPYTSPLLTTSMYNKTCKETRNPVRIRGYISEPLLIAKKLMGQQNLDVDIRAVIRKMRVEQPDVRLPGSGDNNESDFLLCHEADCSRWTLTNDHTLIGSFKSQLLRNIPSKIHQDNIEEWDSHGIELISPILQLNQKEEAIRQLTSYLSSLSTSPDVGILSSTWAGLHVHIGFSATKPVDLDLNMLQHLAYILLLHEDLITSMFPTHCSGRERVEEVAEEPEDPYANMTEEEFEEAWAREQAAQDAAEKSSAEEVFTGSSTAPNNPISGSKMTGQKDMDLEAQNEVSVLTAERSFTNHQNKLSNARHLASALSLPHPAPAEAVATAIFNTRDIPELIRLLQKPNHSRSPTGEGDVYRGYMYNFSNILEFYESGGSKGKPTVEFRQHECTISADAVGQWVVFLEGVVRKAEEMATATAATTSETQNVAADAGRDKDDGDAEATSTEDTSPRTEISKCCHAYNSPMSSLHDFCHWTKLSEDGIDYWTARRDHFSQEAE